MKLTKVKLKQIIKEEMQNIIVSEQDMEEPAAVMDTPEEETAPERERDVDVVLTYIKKIDRPQEYEELVRAVVSHGQNVRTGKLILTKLARELPKTARGMQ